MVCDNDDKSVAEIAIFLNMMVCDNDTKGGKLYLKCCAFVLFNFIFIFFCMKIVVRAENHQLSKSYMDNNHTL